MADEPRLTLPSLKILRTLLEDPMQPLAGVDIHKRAHVSTGTLYPILLRLEAAGWLQSAWEAIDPAEAGRPRKRFYRLTPTGLVRAGEAIASLGGEAPTWA